MPAGGTALMIIGASIAGPTLMRAEVFAMNVDLEQHAEAILRPLGLKLDHIAPHLQKPILTACAALFDAGALAMREAAEKALMHSCHDDMTRAEECDVISATAPATLRTGGSHD